jgi:hypothetical protein
MVRKLLDGMPLALERAASRLRALSIRDLASRLTTPLGLLAADQRRVSRQLSVLAGGWTLHDAESAFGAEVIQGSIRLVDHAFVLVDRTTPATFLGWVWRGRITILGGLMASWATWSAAGYWREMMSVADGMARATSAQ